MKSGIHPDWHHDCKVTCTCGNSFTIGSVFESLNVDICSACHPFFTGEVRFVDRQGRVDRFNKKMVAAEQAKQKTTAKKVTKQAEVQKSYKDILRDQRSQLRDSQKAAVAKSV